MIEARVSSHDLEKLSKGLGRRTWDIELAMRRAIPAFLSKIKSEVSKAVSKRGIPRSEVDKIRIRMGVNRRKMQAYLWVGSNQIDIRYLNPRVTKNGIKAGGVNYPKAFMPWWKTEGRTIIFQRVGKERLPVDVPGVEINEIVLEEIDNLWHTLEAYFDQRFEAELANAKSRRGRRRL